jgi:hypothetical protein
MRVEEWSEPNPRHREYITEQERFRASYFQGSSLQRDNAVGCLAEELCRLEGFFGNQSDRFSAVRLARRQKVEDRVCLASVFWTAGLMSRGPLVQRSRGRKDRWILIRKLSEKCVEIAAHDSSRSFGKTFPARSRRFRQANPGEIRRRAEAGFRM